MADEAGQVRREELDPEAEARRRVALARIRQFGDPALRIPAREVEDFDEELHRLAARMTALMQEARGVGLAANQVGVVRRIIVLQPDSDEDAYALVNPRVAKTGRSTESAEEGCLSLRGVLVPVERPTRVKIEAQNLDGEPIELELDDLAARVVQHEIDHLDGVLILDRTTPEARRDALGTLRPTPVLR